MGEEDLGLAVLQLLVFLPPHPTLHVADLTGLTRTVRLLYHADEQGVVDNVVGHEELRILLYDVEQMIPLFLLQEDRRTLLEVIVLLGRSGILIKRLTAQPRPFDIIPLNYLLASVENIGHDDEVTATNLVAFFIFLDEFMEAKKFGDEGVWVLLDVVIVVLEDVAEVLILAVADGLEHVLAISSVVKEGATLALTGQRSH